MDVNKGFDYPNTKQILKSLSVLIAEDEEMTLGILTRLISSYVKKVYKAKDGKEALKIFNNNEVDLLITDYWMPEKDGLELIKEIKRDNPDLPVILLTAHSDGINVVDAVNFGISRFLTKPVDFDNLQNAIEYSIQNIIIKRLELANKQKEIELLKFREKSHQLQENQAYAKQLNIIKNDLTNSSPVNNFKDKGDIFYFHHYYKPFEILSGDCYSLRKLDGGKYLLFILDTMGKGLSASVTAISSTSYINHLINRNIYDSDSSLHSIVDRYLYFVREILLEEEMVCGIFCVFDFENYSCDFVNFSMPPVFIQDMIGDIKRLKSNEMPITAFTQSFKIKKIDLYDTKKIVLCSDGLIEAMANNNDIYLNTIEKDMRKSEYFPDLQEHIEKNIEEIPDDTTIFFINSVSVEGCLSKDFIIKSTNEDINKFLTNVYKRTEKLKKFATIIPKLTMVLNELLINAHEHGNLAITPDVKNRKIFEESYDRYVEEKEKNVNKNIHISFIVSLTRKEVFLIVTDEGEGFSPHIMSKEKPNSENFSGRGLKMVKSLSKDFFLNNQGNQITAIIDLNP